MDSSERPNPHPHRTSELFICFTSRLSSSSSSSMKISSKSSILSPARGRDGGPVSLSASLSRRLKTNGSLKGGQSPMFPTGGKKRGVPFENPEPSSPKVTCIGQVRVKTKKQGKKIRTLSRKRRGEVSFRRGESGNHQHQQQQESRNQRWVHLPLTICEAVKSCGAEFSCLFPCFSPTGDSGKEERGSGSSERRSGHGGSEESSCGAVFARWFVALNDGEEEGGKGRRREVELVVGGDEEEVAERGGVTRERSLRRHVFEEIEIKDEKCEVKGGEEEEEEEEEGRVSICIPPKNALLLMRCRSDPIRVSALANRFWESPGVPKCEGEDDDDADDVNKEVEDEEEIGVEDVQKSGGLKGDFRLMEDEEVEESEKILLIEANEEEEEEEEKLEGEAEVVMEVAEEAEGEEYQEEEEKLEINDELQQEVEEEDENPEQEVNQEVAAEENELNNSPSEAVVVDLEKLEIEDDVLLLIQEMGEEKMEERRASHRSEVSVHLDSPEEELEVEVAEEATLEKEEEEEEKSTEEKETLLKEEGEEEIVTQKRPESEQTQVEECSLESEEREEERHRKVERESSPVLPDCLLLMRCEPKLSMEVSKETWVCSTDFIRWLPERKA